MEKKTDKTIQEKLHSAIHEGEVRMRSKSYFVARTGLFLFAGLIMAVAVVYLLSFVLYTLHIQGTGYLPRYGLRGVREFLISFPWILALVAVIFLLILEYVVHKTKVAYRRPLLYSVVGVTVIVAVAGIVVAEFPIHGTIYSRVSGNEVPLVSPIYKQLGKQQPRTIHHGYIRAVSDSDDVLRFETPRQEVLTILVASTTRYRKEWIKPDTFVVVFGARDGDEITAYGIRKAPEKSKVFWLEREPNAWMLR